MGFTVQCYCTMVETRNENSRRTQPVGGTKAMVGGFKRGQPYHGPSDTVMPELNQDDFSRVAQITTAGLETVFDADGRTGKGKTLRPQHDQCPE